MSAVSQMALASYGGIGGIGGNDAFTNIMLHLEGANLGTTFADSNANSLAHTWTAHSATTATGTFKFGSASLNCGSTGWIDTPDSADFTLGAGDWTVDGWFNVQGGAGTVRRAFGQLNTLGTIASVNGGLLAGNVFFLQPYNGALVLVTGTTAITSVGWHHYAGVRTGNILRLFVDGVQEGGDVAFTGTVTDSADTFSVGRAGAFTSNTWNGFIDEFRLSVGIARWTTNFTPPAAQYS